MGTAFSSVSSSALRVVASGSGTPSSRSHNSGARNRASSWTGRAEVAISATPSVATAVRSSARINAATGSAVSGSRASTSVISSTPPPCRMAVTAEATVLSRSSAASAPTSGPSSSTSLRPAHTARTSVALPTPAGPDTSTPRLVPAPRVFSRCGSSSASLSHSVSLAACACEPFRSSTPIAGLATLTCWCRWPPKMEAELCAIPWPQETRELGCTLTGPSGSTPVTVRSSEVQLIPTAEARARLAADVDVPGPRSRGSSDTASPTVITLPSNA